MKQFAKTARTIARPSGPRHGVFAAGAPSVSSSFSATRDADRLRARHSLRAAKMATAQGDPQPACRTSSGRINRITIIKQFTRKFTLVQAGIGLHSAKPLF
jgi:hypothetical protein